MKNRPPYAIQSVDSALLLAQLLILEGPLGVTEAAERLGVSVSTAHRLLAMLVYRDFAEQSSDRRYRAGPAINGALMPDAPVRELREKGRRPMERLVEVVEESANLMVLSGDEVRFVLTVECQQVLRVGDRAGKALPAHLSSGGKAMLAMLDKSALRQWPNELSPPEWMRLTRELNSIRANGFAINHEATEAGLSALGMAVRSADGAPVAAISLAIPSARFRRDDVQNWIAQMSVCTRTIERSLAER